MQACRRPAKGETLQVSQAPLPVPPRLSMRQIAYPDVLELHVAVSAGVQLQRNPAIEGRRLGVGKIHHGHTVQAGLIAIPIHLYQVVVPLAHPDHALIFRGRPNHPPPPILCVYACSVMHHLAVDLELHTLRHIRSSGFEGAVEEDSAIAISYTLEAQGKLEVLVVLLRLEISVILGKALAVN